MSILKPVLTQGTHQRVPGPIIRNYELFNVFITGISSEYFYSLVMWKFIFNMREILLNELVTQENIGINQK